MKASCRSGKPYRTGGWQSRRVLKSTFLRVPASRIPTSPRLRLPRLTLSPLIEREASFTIKVVKVLRLDEIETRTCHALEQRHDLIMRD